MKQKRSYPEENMPINNESSVKSRKLIVGLKLGKYIVFRSMTIGLMSGSVLGMLFGCYFVPTILVTGVLGAGLGLGLGFVNGLLLSAIACLFFYPLKDAWVYHETVKVISISVAGGGVAIFGPWYFSSTGMTPNTAVFIGFNSVLASVIAGWAGALTGKNISQWYEQKIAESTQESTLSRALPNPISPNKAKLRLKAISLSRDSGWIGVALLSLLSSFVGRHLLQFLVCGTQDVYFCLSSPRLYTSVIAGFKVVLPVVFAVVLMLVVLRSRHKRRA